MKIGFIGLGIMGESMCENIVKKHDDKVYAFDFVKEKVDLLASKGAIPCKDSVELAKASDVIISMVPKSEHSRSVYTSILDVLDSSKTCIDMSTIDPSVSVEISEMVKKKGAAFIDAPVVKSKPAAIAGKLGIYVGGDEETYEKMRPILLYGGGQNFYLDSKAAPIEKEDYTTAFSIENMHKDVNICMKLAEECGFNMPGEANACRVYDEAMKQGFGKEDFCATIKVVRGQ